MLHGTPAPFNQLCVCVCTNKCVWSPPRYQHILFPFTLSFISLSFSTSVSLVSVSFVCLCDAAVLCVPVSPPPFHTCSVSLHSVTLCHLQLFYTARLYLSPSSLTLFLLFFSSSTDCNIVPFIPHFSVDTFSTISQFNLLLPVPPLLPRKSVFDCVFRVGLVFLFSFFSAQKSL